LILVKSQFESERFSVMFFRNFTSNIKSCGKYVFASVFSMAAIVMISYFCSDTVMAAAKVPSGISIDGTDVSGMTEQEVDQVVASYVASVGKSVIKLSTDEKSVDAKASDLGIKNIDDKTVKKAVNYLSSGNPLERLSKKEYLKAGNTKDMKLSFTCDPATVNSYLEANKANLSNPTIDNGLKRENGQFVFVPGTAGKSINVANASSKVISYVEKDWDRKDGKVTLDTEKSEPRGSKEELSKVKDLLGTATTDYSSSAEGRKHNVAKGAAFLNGTIMYPGDIVSVYDKVSPLSVENGYEVAGGYANGQSVEAEGGGICQVATTTYDAVINAELGIETRSSHSLTVHYVDVSFDAAIAASSDGKALKDLKFKNTLNAPVYIETSTNGSTITVNIYGQETRPAERKVTYENTVDERYDIVNKFTEDPALPVGTIRRTTSGQTGYKAKLWKVVTVNGVEQSRTIQNRSTYKMAEGSYTVGTASADPAQTQAMQAALATGDQNNILTTAASITGTSPITIGDRSAKQTETEKQAAAAAKTSGVQSGNTAPATTSGNTVPGQNPVPVPDTNQPQASTP
jgi:vancomycin resistance protein YoaR